ncbi:MAG: DUF167 domain-containing protein [Planctomycetes bacterium]|nr:DUF167 domain-containing protein [Planctomycetota bacterium]
MSAAVELVAEDAGKACVLPVRAQPGARRAGLAGTWNGMLKLAVSAPPEDGRANAELQELVAELFRLKKHEVRLVAGEKARAKRFRLALALPLARTRLDALLAEHGDTP